MRIPGLSRNALTSCMAVAMFAGCGGSQSTIGAPGVVPQDATIATGTAQGRSATASEKVIYSFQGAPDAANPSASLINVDGTFYGTTEGGGSAGTVYSISPSGGEHVVYSFKGGSDGASPRASLIDLDGVLYGTTTWGGNRGCLGGGCGTVFAVNPASAEEQILHRFKGGSDGADPGAALVAVNGTLYGVAGAGPTRHCVEIEHCYGTIFSVNPKSGREHVLYRFKGGRDGMLPTGLMALGNTLYGTTNVGGSLHCPDHFPGCGTVFAFDIPSGLERIVYRFRDTPDGAHPNGSLIYMRGLLYGTTDRGGIRTCAPDRRAICGTVFSIQPSSGQERIVYRFLGGSNVSFPVGSLLAFNGALYGAAAVSGDSCPTSPQRGDCGAIFRLTESGRERVLHNFQYFPDGAYPEAGLISVNGVLFGTTHGGGLHNGEEGNGFGTVFTISP
jgi:uncharacterized repeat protein (TIGR03803 family)